MLNLRLFCNYSQFFKIKQKNKLNIYFKKFGFLFNVIVYLFNKSPTTR
jgi:hypothetical protein